MAPITVGDKIPDGTLAYFNEEGNLQQVSVHSLAAGKKIILFGVPGAFTPTCSLKHVPGFIEKAEELKAKGVDDIILISVNDPFVMKEWAKTYPNNKHVKFLADGSAKYTHALGLELDLSEKGLGIRSRRFAIVCDDLEVKVANIEEGGSFEVSSAEDILKITGLKHVLGFVEKAEELKAKGVDYILLISANDPFEMREWAESNPNNKRVKFLADIGAKYTHALGFEVDLTKKRMGIISRRFALVCDNLGVKVAKIEKGANFDVSSVDDILR